MPLFARAAFQALRDPLPTSYTKNKNELAFLSRSDSAKDKNIIEYPQNRNEVRLIKGSIVRRDISPVTLSGSSLPSLCRSNSNNNADDHGAAISSNDLPKDSIDGLIMSLSGMKQASTGTVKSQVKSHKTVLDSRISKNSLNSLNDVHLVSSKNDEKSHIMNYKGPITRSISKFAARFASLAKSPISRNSKKSRSSFLNSQNQEPDSSLDGSHELPPFIRKQQSRIDDANTYELPPHSDILAQGELSHLDENFSQSSENKRNLSDFFNTGFKNDEELNNVVTTSNDNVDLAQKNNEAFHDALNTLPLALCTNINFSEYPLFALTVTDLLSMSFKASQFFNSLTDEQKIARYKNIYNLNNKKYNDGLVNDFCNALGDSHKSVEIEGGDGYNYEIICIQKPSNRSNPPPVSNSLTTQYKPIVRISMRNSNGQILFSELDMSAHSLYAEDIKMLNPLPLEKRLDDYLLTCNFNPNMDIDSAQDEITKNIHEKYNKLTKLREQTGTIELIRSSIPKKLPMSDQIRKSTLVPEAELAETANEVEARSDNGSLTQDCSPALLSPDDGPDQLNPSDKSIHVASSPGLSVVQLNKESSKKGENAMSCEFHLDDDLQPKQDSDTRFNTLEEQSIKMYSPTMETVMQFQNDVLSHIGSIDIAEVRKSSDKKLRYSAYSNENELSVTKKAISYYLGTKTVPTYEELVKLEIKGVIKVRAEYLKMKMETIEKEYIENEKSRIYELKIQDHDLESKSCDLLLKIKTSKIRISNAVEVIDNCAMKLKARRSRLASEKELCFPSKSRISTIEMDIGVLENEIRNHTETLEELVRSKDQQEAEYDALIQKIEKFRIDRQLEEVKIESQREQEVRLRKVILFIQATGSDVVIKSDGSITAKGLEDLSDIGPTFGKFNIRSNPRRSSFYGVEHHHFSNKFSQLLSNINPKIKLNNPTPKGGNFGSSVDGTADVISNYDIKSPLINESLTANGINSISTLKPNEIPQPSPFNMTSEYSTEKASKINHSVSCNDENENAVNSIISNTHEVEEFSLCQYANKENRSESPIYTKEEYPDVNYSRSSHLEKCMLSEKDSINASYARKKCQKLANIKIRSQHLLNVTGSSEGALSNEDHFTDCEDTSLHHNSVHSTKTHVSIINTAASPLNHGTYPDEKENFFSSPPSSSYTHQNGDVNHNGEDSEKEYDLEYSESKKFDNIIDENCEREQLMERLREQTWKRQGETWNNKGRLPHVPTSGPGSRIPHPVRKSVAIQRMREYYAKNNDPMPNDNMYKEQLVMASTKAPYPGREENEYISISPEIKSHYDEYEAGNDGQQYRINGDSQNYVEEMGKDYDSDGLVRQDTLDVCPRKEMHIPQEDDERTSSYTSVKNHSASSHSMADNDKKIDNNVSSKKRMYPFSPQVPIPTNSSNFFALIYKNKRTLIDEKLSKKPVFTVQKFGTKSASAAIVDKSIRRSIRIMNKVDNIKSRVTSRLGLNRGTVTDKQLPPRNNSAGAPNVPRNVVTYKLHSSINTASHKLQQPNEQQSPPNIASGNLPHSGNVAAENVHKSVELLLNREQIDDVNITGVLKVTRPSDHTNVKKTSTKRKTSSIITQNVTKKLNSGEIEYPVSSLGKKRGSITANKNTQPDNKIFDMNTIKSKTRDEDDGLRSSSAENFNDDVANRTSDILMETSDNVIPVSNDRQHNLNNHITDTSKKTKDEIFKKTKDEIYDELNALDVSNSLSPNLSTIEDALGTICGDKPIYTEEYLIKKGEMYEREAANNPKQSESKGHGFNDYYDDMIDDLFEVEGLYTPSAKCVEQVAYDASYLDRDHVVDWIMGLYACLKLRPETYYLAVNIIDRCITNRGYPVENLKLTALTSLFIAAKYESSHFPSLKYFVIACQKEFTEENIMKNEKLILHAIDYRLNCPNLMYMLRICLKAYANVPEMRSLSRYILDLCTIAKEFVGVPHSRIAAISVTLAKIVLFPNDWDAKFEFPQLLKYDYEELSPDLEKLIVILAQRKKYKTFAQRYTSNRYRLLDKNVDEFVAECKSVAEGL